MELTPRINFGSFQLNIEFTSLTLPQVLVSTTAPKLNDFQFQGTCYFVCQSNITCITALSCTVKPDKIEVSISELTMNQFYVLRFTVLNPPYQSPPLGGVRNFMLWSDAVGNAYDTVNVVPSLSTTPIDIIVAENDLKLFWKLRHSDVRDLMGLGFFIGGGINTVEVGFMISSGSPFG
jgi:hypothetical protein